MKFKLITLIIIIASTFGLAFGTILSGNSVYAAPESNTKCFTTFDKDSNFVNQACGDKSKIDAEKDQCKQADDLKCSSSQTSQGTASNNPNKKDNGLGIFEKFTH